MLMMGVACTPSLNWREVRIELSDVSVLMPCKPDRASRPIALQVKEKTVSTNLHLLGCEASDMQFTFGQIHLPPELPAADVMQAWQQASLAPMNASAHAATTDPFSLRGALPVPEPMRRRLKTATHQVQWLWWARGDMVYQVALYGGLKSATFDDTADTYFSGIKLP